MARKADHVGQIYRVGHLSAELDFPLLESPILGEDDVARLQVWHEMLLAGMTGDDSCSLGRKHVQV